MGETAATTGSRISKALGKVLNAVIVLLVVLCFGLMLSANTSKDGSSLLGFRSFIVLSGSMSPAFDAGSYIIVREKKPENIQVGDILTYRVDSNTILTHRVVEIMQDDGIYSFRTQGDANNTPDVIPVLQDRAIGTTIFWINGLGTLLLSLQQPRNLIAVCVLACVIFLTPEIYGLVKKRIFQTCCSEGSEIIEKDKL